MLSHAAWLAGCCISPPYRRRCIDALESLVGRLQARFDPLELGLADTDTDSGELKGLLAGILPVYSAALALTAGCWTPQSRGMTVRAVRASDCPPPGRCVAAWQPEPGDAQASQARFLAWPVTHALLFRLESAGDAERALESLRERIGQSSTIALALDAASQQRQGPSDLPRLQELSRRVVRLQSGAREKPDPLLEGLASEDATPLLAWLSLGPGDLMVVPRLGALATRARFLAEAEVARLKVVERFDPVGGAAG